MGNVEHLSLEILNAARRWARARVAFRRVLDSKKATPAQTDAVKNTYNRASHELETMVGNLEQMLVAQGKMMPAKRRPKNGGASPWEPLLKLVVQAGAQALNDAVNPNLPTAPSNNVIDVPSEVEKD